MSSESETEQEQYGLLSKALADEFGVPEDKTSALIDAIPLIHQGMQISDTFEFVDIPSLLKSDELSETEKKIFAGIEKDALEKALIFVNDHANFIPTAVSYGNAWDWSKADVEWPEDENIKAVADFLLTDYLTRKYKKDLAEYNAKAQKMNDSVKTIMYDSMEMDMDSDSITVQDGKLTGKTVMTAAMVQEYKRDDGTTQRVLKCPDELKLAVDFCKQIPCTDGHPPARIVDDHEQIKGWTDVPKYNDEIRRVETEIEVTDADLIKKIQDGKTDVSIGFVCELDEKAGKFIDNDKKEHEYDAVQRNMVLNHLALGIDSGRCPGHVCGVGIDSAMTPVTADDNPEDEPADEPEANPKEDKPVEDAKLNCTCLLCGKKQTADEPVHEQRCIECNNIGSLRQMTPQAMTGGGLDEKTELIDLIDIDSMLLSHAELDMEKVPDFIYDSYELEGDAVLTAAQRKELPADVFCGPNRSFPVPDCAHVTAARRLIGRYKGPGSKDNILDCVNKIAKKLNCPGADEDETPDPESTDPVIEEPTADPPADVPNKDADVSTHEKLLKEKTDAIRVLAKKLDSVGSMDIKDVRAVVGQIETITWDLSKTANIVQTGKIGVDETVMNDATNTLGIAFKLIADNKQTATDFPPKTDAERAMDHFKLSKEEWDALSKEEQDALIAKLPMRGAATGPEDKKDDPPAEDSIPQEKIDEAYKQIETNKTQMIDAIMDFEPLKPRAHYEGMTHRMLTEIHDAFMLQKKERDTSGSDGKTTSVDQAYANLQKKNKR